MAEVFVSGGVYTQETNNTFTPGGVANGDSASVVGLFQKGPAYLPIEVGSYGEQREIFGDLDDRMYATYGARSYLRNGTSLNVVRVLGRGTATVGTAVVLAFPPGTDVGSATGVSGAAAALSASNTVLGILRLRGDVEQVMLSGSPTNFAIAIPGKGVTSDGLSLVESSNNYVKKVLGTNPLQAESGDALTALYVDTVYDYEVTSVTGSVSGDGADGLFSSCTSNSTQVTGGFAPASTPVIVSQNFGGVVYDLFRLYTRSDGDAANADIKVSITQVDLTSTAAPTFSVVVREAGDTDEQPVILESFADVNLDRSSKQFIGRVIGDRKPVYDLTQDPPEILFDGDYENRSRFVRVEVYDGYPDVSRPSGYKGVDKIIPGPYLPELPEKTNQLNARSEVDSRIFLGVNFDLGGVFDRTKKTTTSASASTSADTGLLIFAASGDLSGSGTITSYTLVDMVGSNSGNFSSTNKVRFTMPVFGGFDGFDPRSDLRVDVNDGTLSADFYKAIDTLANKDEIDMNLLAAPGAHSSSVGNIPQKLVDVAEARGDSFVIVDISDGTTTAAPLAMTIASAQSERDKYDTTYAATYYPWVQIYDPTGDKLLWVPPSVEMMGVYAFNDAVGEPWFAPAGFTRGGLENVVNVRRRLTQGQRDDLYSRGVNPIATFPGSGIVVWGQKTLAKKASALDRVNIRRMLLAVRKRISRMAINFVWEQNTPTLRSRLSQGINSYLRSVQEAQGLAEFRAIIDETTTTPDLIDRNMIKGVILLKPTFTVEVIVLDFSLSPSGASFDA